MLTLHKVQEHNFRISFNQSYKKNVEWDLKPKIMIICNSTHTNHTVIMGHDFGTVIGML